MVKNMKNIQKIIFVIHVLGKIVRNSYPVGQHLRGKPYIFLFYQKVYILIYIMSKFEHWAHNNKLTMGNLVKNKPLFL